MLRHGLGRQNIEISDHLIDLLQKLQSRGSAQRVNQFLPAALQPLVAQFGELDRIGLSAAGAVRIGRRLTPGRSLIPLESLMRISSG
jgi:hypothetical protein